MNKKERVIAAIRHEAVDYVPCGFSLHFPHDKAFGEAGVKAHLDFFKETDTDIIKIMNENLFPSNPGVKTSEDFNRIGPFTRKSEFIVHQTDLVKAILDKTGGDSFSVCTIHGASFSFVHTMRPQYQALEEIRRVQVGLYRKNPQPYLDAKKRIAEGLSLLVQSVLEAGCDGIYYAALGAEKDMFTAEEFEVEEAPFDKLVMQTAKEMGKTVILHMCKKKLEMERYASYAPYVDVVNWGIYENNISIEEGERIFPGKTILGGLENRSGIIVDGSLEDIREEVHRLRREMKGKKFILGADCTLGSDLPVERIRTATEAARDSL